MYKNPANNPLKPEAHGQGGIDNPAAAYSMENAECLAKWVQLTKSQSLIVSLLQFELDALLDTIEVNSKSISENFQDLVCNIKQKDSADGTGTAELSEKISANIAKIVQGMQCHDLANQKVENISNVLGALDSAFNELLEETVQSHSEDLKDIQPDVNNILSVIKGRSLGEMRYRMTENLRKISSVDIGRFDDDGGCPRDEDDGSDIELF